LYCAFCDKMLQWIYFLLTFTAIGASVAPHIFKVKKF
jgi:hypothetical protein